MTANVAWMAAFPLAQADKAVTAVRDAWKELATTPKPQFNHATHEPHLTRVLKDYVDKVIKRRCGLLGFWGTESVENDVNFVTGAIEHEHRTDLVYAWNDHQQEMRLVFEFKKLAHGGASRSHYMGDRGLLRFVTGPYSHGQSVAAMVGILVSPKATVVPPLKVAMGAPDYPTRAQLIAQANGQLLAQPSVLFPSGAEFDTVHSRPSPMGPSHGTIHVAHLFLEFGYPPSSASPKAPRKRTTTPAPPAKPSSASKSSANSKLRGKSTTKSTAKSAAKSATNGTNHAKGKSE